MDANPAGRALLAVPGVALGAQKCHQHRDSPVTHTLGALSSSCQLFLQPWIQSPQRNQNQFRHLIPGCLRENWFGINRVQRGSESPWNVLGWKGAAALGMGGQCIFYTVNFLLRAGVFYFFIIEYEYFTRPSSEQCFFWLALHFSWLCTLALHN